MWVHKEDVYVKQSLQEKNEEKSSKEKLSMVINQTHENVKYLPGITLPENVVAVPDLTEACRGANLLLFVVPHQFLPSLLPTIEARGMSLIKGLGECRFRKLLKQSMMTRMCARGYI